MPMPTSTTQAPTTANVASAQMSALAATATTPPIATPAPTQTSAMDKEISGGLGPSAPSSPCCIPSPVLTTNKKTSGLGSGLDESDRPPPPPPPHRRASVPASQLQDNWLPTYKPSWTLGPQHQHYVHTAAPYLIGVPGGQKWEKLLASYITFESLSAARSVSTSLFVYTPPANIMVGNMQTTHEAAP
jgi:hypothetical protein